MTDNMIKMAAFNEELIKLGWTSLLAKGINSFPAFAKGLKALAGKAPTKLMHKPATGLSSKLKTSILDDAAKQGWLSKKLGIKGFRGMMGPKSKLHSINEVVESPIKKIPFFSKTLDSGVKIKGDPLGFMKNTAHRVAASQAQNLQHIKDKGLWNFAKTELKNSQYYTRNVTKGGKTYGVKMHRSLAGKALNPVFSSGVGFGAFELATNKKDEYGRVKPMGKRLGSAGAEAFKWGVAGPLMGAKMMAYDLPKMGIDLVKGF